MKKLTILSVYTPVDDETYKNLLNLQDKIFARMIVETMLKEGAICPKYTNFQTKMTATS